MLLEVRADNRPALAFYAHHGFVEIDRRDRYYADGATAVVMQAAARSRLRCPRRRFPRLRTQGGSSHKQHCV